MSLSVADMLIEVEDFTERMTPWEREFVESVADQFTRNGRLSPAQTDKLADIHKKYLG